MAPRVNNGVSMGCEEIQPEISFDILRQYVRYMIYMFFVKQHTQTSNFKTAALVEDEAGES